MADKSTFLEPKEKIEQRKALDKRIEKLEELINGDFPTKKSAPAGEDRKIDKKKKPAEGGVRG